MIELTFIPRDHTLAPEFPPLCYTSPMLPRIAFAIVICMSTFAAAQSLPVPQAVTDPALLLSATVDNLQKFSIATLYSTRQIGGGIWSPDAGQVAFISNISGRNNLWTISAGGGWPSQLTISYFTNSGSEAAPTAFSFTSSAIAFADLSNTAHWWPPFKSRRTIFAPIRPRPIIPSCMR